MIEGLFILTTIFVAYIVSTIISEQKAIAKSKTPTVKPEAQAVAVEAPKPQIVVAKEEPVVIKPVDETVAPKAVATKTAATKPALIKAKPKAAKKTAAVTAKNAGLKDPKTGDVVTAYSNYRFTKRWIKEALVAEGLLEKVYAGKELNAETEAKIKEAIGKLEAIDKYKA